MDISSLSGISSEYLEVYAKSKNLTGTEDKSFGNIFTSMMESLDETNALQNKAQSEEIRFAMGESENTHDLLIAESKANIALQYTVAVRDKLIEGYRELMQMSV